MVASSPIRSAMSGAARNEAVCSSPSTANVTATVVAEAPNRVVSQ
jgi:hypothetical protein